MNSLIVSPSGSHHESILPSVIDSSHCKCEVLKFLDTVSLFQWQEGEVTPPTSPPSPSF